MYGTRFEIRRIYLLQIYHPIDIYVYRILIRKHRVPNNHIHIYCALILLLLYFMT